MTAPNPQEVELAEIIRTSADLAAKMGFEVAAFIAKVLIKQDFSRTADTLERAAKVADDVASKDRMPFPDSYDPYDPTHMENQGYVRAAEVVAAAIRALKDNPKHPEPIEGGDVGSDLLGYLANERRRLGLPENG